MAWLILGLFESQRGRDAAAVTAAPARPKEPTHRSAAELLPGPSPGSRGPTRPGRRGVRTPIARKPTRADLLEVYQAAGRSYQRTRQNDRALAVWNRLEAQFPNDLPSRNRLPTPWPKNPSLPRPSRAYEGLAAAVKDQYRQVQFRIEAAEIKVRLARTADALTDFRRPARSAQSR